MRIRDIDGMSPGMRIAVSHVAPKIGGAALLLGMGADAASAACPLCFVTAGLGLLVARAFGLSMEVVGALSGGVSVILALWMHYAIKRGRFPWRPVVFSVLTVLLNNAMLAWGALSHPARFVYLSLASSVSLWAWAGGSILFVAIMASKAQKRAFGTTLFPFQTVVVSVAALVLTTVAAAWGSGGIS